MRKQSEPVPAASRLDVERLLGPLDMDVVMAVMALSPTLKDVEKAALHLAGEDEALEEPHQPHGTVRSIIELVTSDDEDERRSP